MVEKLEKMHTGKTNFLILNCKNMILLELKTSFKFCQKCLLLYVKHSRNNIKPVVSILTLKEPTYFFFQ